MEIDVLTSDKRSRILDKYFDKLPFYLDPNYARFDLLMIYKGSHPIAIFNLIHNNNINEFLFPYNQPLILENNPNLTMSKVTDLRFEVYDTLYKYLLSVNEDYIFSTDPLYLSDLRPFLWNKYNSESKKVIDIEVRYTGILNLLSAKDFELQYSGSRKRDVRYAKRNCKVEIKDVDIESCARLISFYESNFKRQGLSFEMDKKYLIQRINHSLFKQINIIHENEVIYTAFVSISDRKCVYHFASGNEISYKLFASSLAVEEAINYAILHNCEIFNVEGVNSPDRGSFKLSFGLELKTYHEVTIENK